MSRLNKLFGKGQDFEIGGEVFNIKPLTLSEMDLAMKLEKGDPAALKNLIFKVLKESVPDATEEEMVKISIDNIQKFAKAIAKVNGIEDMPTKTE